MKTSWNDLADIEKYILGELKEEDSLFFQAKLLTNPVLKLNFHLQQSVYTLIRYYHHKKLRKEVEAAHEKMFSNQGKLEFQQTIFQLFKS